MTSDEFKRALARAVVADDRSEYSRLAAFDTESLHLRERHAKWFKSFKTQIAANLPEQNKK